MDASAARSTTLTVTSVIRTFRAEAGQMVAGYPWAAPTGGRSAVDGALRRLGEVHLPVNLEGAVDVHGSQPEEPVTISVVARYAGVSTATVSRVLQGTAATSEEARRKVLEAVNALGYVPKVKARPAGPPERHTFGVLVPELSHYHAEILVGMLSFCADHGLAVLPLMTDRNTDATSAAREMAGLVDGVVIAGGAVPEQLVQALARMMPVVLIRSEPPPRCRAVTMHERDAAQRLTSHLFDHGRSRLVFVGDPDAAPEVAQRYQGFRLAHAAAGLPRRPALRVPLQEGSGKAVAEDLLRRRVPVDGLVCASDEIALGVLAGLADTDMLVPDDVAVVGWGDVDAARFVLPGLTTARLPLRQLGATACEQLTEMEDEAQAGTAEVSSPLLDGDVLREPQAAADRTTTLPTEIVLRASCGCPGHRGRPRPPARPRRPRPRPR